MSRPVHVFKTLLPAAVLIVAMAGCHGGESSGAGPVKEAETGQSTEWFYESFDDSRRAAYDAFKIAAASPFDSEPVSLSDAGGGKAELTVTELGVAYQGFLYDHPEIFWLRSSYNYRGIGATAGEELADAVSVIPIPQSAEDLDQQSRSFESAAQKILDESAEGADDKERAVILYDWITENIQYREEALYDDTLAAEHTAYGSIVGKAAVCDGIVLAYKYLLDRCGVASIVIPGTSSGNPHVWITVFWEGRWHEADPTWDIASKENEKRQYFDLTTEEMSRDHIREAQGIASSIPIAR